MSSEPTVIVFGASEPGSLPGAGRGGAARMLAQPRPSGRLELRVAGPLPLDWSLRVARGLAASRVNVLSGYAHRDAVGSWIGAFEALPPPSAAPLDLTALTLTSTPAPRDDPSILELRMEASSAFGGSLQVEVAAWDAIGLLAGTLGCAAAVGLHPAELILETQEECAFQQLALQTPGAGRPSLRQQITLARALDARLGAG